MKENQDRFISIDWGTSRFRMRLISLTTEKVLEEHSSEQGIAVVSKRWKDTGPQIDKLDYFKQFLAEQLQIWKGSNIEGSPIMISGMASSSIGMLELDYTSVPFVLGKELPIIKEIVAGSTLPHSIYLIGGLSTDQDVMRGEETLLLGLSAEEISFCNHIVLPGTHAKHIVLEDDKLISFQTYMTGELFDLLSTKSILQGSVKHSDFDPDSFLKGVAAAHKTPLLNAVFHTRTNHLLQKLSGSQNYHWLSGLLIGYELAAFHRSEKITLIVGPTLRMPYELALKQLNHNIQIQVLDEGAKIRAGQLALYRRIIRLQMQK